MQEKIIQTKNCKKCSANFDITDKDLEFYKKISPKFGDKTFEIPIPTLCPDCRKQRRLAFRNERKFYKRKCDATGENIISIYSPDKSYKVYSQDFWWSDKWDSLAYGRDFYFGKSLFEQFSELFREVPKVGIINKNSTNSEYTNICANNKDCYLLVESSDNEKCMYSYWIQNCNHCLDSNFSSKCENCYNIDNCFGCYKLFNSKDCNECSFSSFLQNCRNCEFCYNCKDLEGKKYFIDNKEFSKQEYEEKISQLSEDIELNHRTNQIKNSQNCSGDYIIDSNNCINCYHAQDASDCKNSNHIWRHVKDVYDCDTVGMNSELMYESMNTAINCFKNLFCNRCWTVSNSIYCYDCDNSSNLFGCVGLRNKEYCILNKQYTKEEYNKLVPKIIEKMKQDGEWGEFFPASLSPFGYNETVAMEYFPINPPIPNPFPQGEKGDKMFSFSIGGKDAGKADRGNYTFNWSTYEPPFPKVDKIIPAKKLPEDISKIPDDILNWAIECEVSKKPFRIIAQELEFYRKHNLPIPRKHPDVRHEERMRLRKV